MAITEKQQQAINFDKGNLLVSASAGSGKTFVMIERIKRLLLEEKANIDEILCVTFTVLAAHEMKQKLSDKLIKSVKEGADEKIIERNLDLLPTANISTIHAFCKNLLTEFFYDAGLDPAFTILDSKQDETIANRAIDALFEDLYEEDSEILKVLLPRYFKKRSDGALKAKVREIYNFIISEAHPMEILEKGRYYYTEKSVDELYDHFISEAKDKAKNLIKIGNEIMSSSSDYEKMSDHMAILLNSLQIAACAKDEGELLEFSRMTYPTKPSVRSTCGDPFLLELNAKINAFKANLKAFKENISYKLGNSRETEKQWALKSAPLYDAMVKLVEMYNDYYQRERREENGVNYSDLEHLTLKLLENEEIRKEISSRYKYIFTDEYQDTSGVQEAILTLISNENLFMVGDVKQCIYYFRGCNPDIFASKFQRYKKGEGGCAISLDQNFRSTKKVIDAVNNVFCAIMNKSCGMVEYKDAKMIKGAPYPDDEGEVKMFSVKKNKAENKLPTGIYSITKHLEIIDSIKEFSEGREIATLINNIVGKKYYSLSSNSYETLNYKDIVILLRVMTHSDDYANELVKAGIPVSAQSKKSIGEYAEVRFAINVLELIDCFNQDIPLAAVLKSPIGKLDDSDLLKIRKKYQNGTFVECFNKYKKEQNDEISKKLNDFTEYFNKLRLLSEFVPCDKLLSDIVRENEIDVKLLSERMGEFKLARLNKFIQCSGSKGEMVHEFLQDIDEKLSEITMDFSDDNAVKIMTIHSSKGLEFPVVILGGISSPYSKEGLKGDFLMDRNLGMALNYLDEENRIYHKTIYSKFVYSEKKNREREEQMRLLYVAMTRAKSSLYMFNEYSNEKYSSLKDNHFEDDVHSAGKYYDLFAEGDFENTPCKTGEEVQTETQEIKQVLIGDGDEEMTNIIKNNLTFQYGHKDNMGLAVKRSVTDVAHFDEDDQILYEKTSIFGNSDSETGTAYHRFLEVCDFYKDAQSEYNRLIGSLLLTEDQKKLIDPEKIERIFQMPVFVELKGYDLLKEQPFTCFMPGKMLDENYQGDGEVLIQGVIDLLCVKGDEAIVVDYKHSAIKNDCDLVSKYKKQLELYSYAVEKVLKKKVNSMYLVNIYSARTVKVEIN